MQIIDKEFWIDLGSDWTMNSLRRFVDCIDHKCLLVDDAVVLLNSKVLRAKDRLVGGLGEWISEEQYTYRDFGKTWTLSGIITMVINITSESFLHNKDTLFGSTFIERFLPVHHAFTKLEKEAWILNEANREIKWHKKITLADIETKLRIPSEYFPFIEHLSKEYSYDSLKSPISCKDLIIATLNAHAALNKRNEVCIDDFVLIKRIQPYLVNPFSPYEGKIVRLRAQGLSMNEIGKAIHKGNYIQQIQRVIKKAELSSNIGILSKEMIGIGFQRIPGSRIFFKKGPIPIVDIFQSKLRFYIPSRNSLGLLWIQDETKGLINKEITGIKFSSFGKYDKLKDAIINDTELCNTLRRLLLTPFDLDEIKAIKEEAEAAIGRKIKQSIIDKVTKKGAFLLC